MDKELKKKIAKTLASAGSLIEDAMIMMEVDQDDPEKEKQFIKKSQDKIFELLIGVYEVKQGFEK